MPNLAKTEKSYLVPTEEDEYAPDILERLQRRLDTELQILQNTHITNPTSRKNVTINVTQNVFSSEVLTLLIKVAKEELISDMATQSSEIGVTLREKERHNIIAALEANNWVQKNAATFLGISPRVMTYKIQQFKITHHTWRKNI